MSIENYTHVRVARSDGQGYDVKNVELGLREDDRTLPVDQNGEQPSRWKATIGAHLKYQFLKGTDGGLYILRDFPAGYELRLQSKKDKTLGFLYGHPKDSRARYRTPGDFVPHLLWLISESDNRHDCSCQFCQDMSSKETQAEGGANKLVPAVAAVPAAAAVNSGQPPPGPQGQPQPWPQPSAAPAVSPAVQHPPPPQLATSQVASKPVEPMSQPPLGNLPSPPPGVVNPSNVFRIGELVWYKNKAWRLGIVLVIGPKTNTPNPGQGEEHSQFLLAPLGHSLLGQQNIIKEAAEMRPFLTFSVPDISLAELRDKSFAHVDWQSIINRYGRDPDLTRRARQLEVIGLEASKMAARAINGSFSTFNQLPGPPTVTGPNAYSTRYGGIYLGAEMICLGDPVRVTTDELQPASESISTVMIVQEIHLNTSSDTAPSLKFRGSIYQLRRAEPSQMDIDTSRNHELGPACLDEVNFRNELAGGTAGGRWMWAPLEHNATRAEVDVQGRFYVTHRLMRIVDPARFEAAVQQRALEDAQAYLNSRMQGGTASTTTTGFPGWHPGRAATIGAAVAVRLTLPEGVVETQFGTM